MGDIMDREALAQKRLKILIEVHKELLFAGPVILRKRTEVFYCFWHDKKEHGDKIVECFLEISVKDEEIQRVIEAFDKTYEIISIPTIIRKPLIPGEDDSCGNLAFLYEKNSSFYPCARFLNKEFLNEKPYFMIIFFQNIIKLIEKLYQKEISLPTKWFSQNGIVANDLGNIKLLNFSELYFAKDRTDFLDKIYSNWNSVLAMLNLHQRLTPSSLNGKYNELLAKVKFKVDYLRRLLNQKKRKKIVIV